MKIKELIHKIGEEKDVEKMRSLGRLFEKAMCELEIAHKEKYDEYVCELYEIAYGEKLTEELASRWIMSMKPYGLKWNLEQTSNVLKEQGLDLDKIDFWAVMNAMYNDYFSIFGDDVEKYFELAKNFICDEDAAPNKVYLYWKYCTRDGE